MRFHQVVVSAAPGDAVTNSAFELRSLLRRVGPSEIFALNIAPALADEVLPIGEYNRHHAPLSAGSVDNIILFHGSIGSPEVFSFIHSRPERIVLVYHNVSPASAFLPYDPRFAGLLESGRRDIAGLKDKVVLAIAPSHYNAAELLAMGYRDVRVTPLIVDVDRLMNHPGDRPTMDRLAAQPGPIVLYVGQLLPHKRPDFLLAAFHILQTHLVPEARLVLIGAGRLAEYRRLLETFSTELNLRNVEMPGAVSDTVRNSYYRAASVFATASEHEGFCVPLLEAMAFELPPVARAFGAVAETMGEAGVLLPPECGPAVFAEAIAETLMCPTLRVELAPRSRERLACFDADRARADYLEHLLSVA